MTPVEIVELQRAFGYAGTGALVLKALDMLIKWRKGQRSDLFEEMRQAREAARDIRTEMRQELTAVKRELLEEHNLRIAAEERERICNQRFKRLSDEMRSFRHLQDEIP